jgi:hypothetical protein
LSQDELREVWLTYDRCYDALAFPGGWEGATCRLLAGDPECMEAAICFLEVRPYFYHSGYMFNSLLRKAKRAPLDPEQLERLGRRTRQTGSMETRQATKASARLIDDFECGNR